MVNDGSKLYTPEGLPIVSRGTVPRDLGETVGELPEVYKNFIGRENEHYLRFIENISEYLLWGEEQILNLNLFSLSAGYVLLDTQGRINEGEDWRGLPKVTEKTYGENYFASIAVSRSIREEGNERRVLGKMMRKYGGENLELMKGHLNFAKKCKASWGMDVGFSCMLTSCFSWNILKDQAVKDRRVKAVLDN